jgi:hypothetical protein
MEGFIMNVIYKNADGTIIDFIEGMVSGLNSDFSVAEIDGTYSTGAVNISELTLKPHYVTKKQMFERLAALGKDEIVWNALTVSQQLEFMNLDEGILTNDENVKALLIACGVEPSSILY